MTAPSTELAERLRESVVGLRDDLQLSRHVFRGEVYYILRDPVTFDSNRFSVDDYRILTHLSPHKTLGECFQTVVEDGLLDPEDEERFYRFVVSLHQLHLLGLPLADDAALYRRHESRRSSKRRQQAMALFFLQVPLWNPDAFLERTLHLARPFFTRAFFVAWLGLLALCSVLVVQNWGDLTAPLAGVFSAGNLLILWGTLIILKIAHEFGHAYACKLFGGTVPEMGAFFIVLTPCAYVDATASWSFRRKLHRLIVCLAGMYVEVTLACLALIVWTVTPPGLVNSIAHNVMLLGSVVTVVMNLNPLMKFDGYYAFCDLFEVPNLRQRATAYTGAFFARLALGTQDDADWGGRGHRVFLLVFGVCGAIYKVLVVTGISAAIATKYFFAGMFLGATYVGMELLRMTSRLLKVLWNTRGTRLMKARALVAAAAVFLLLPAGMFLLPVPVRVVAPCVFTTQDFAIVRAGADGFLESLEVEPGHQIEDGTSLGHLQDEELIRRVREADAELAVAEIEHRSADADGPVRRLATHETLDYHREQVALLRRDLARLDIPAPCSGQVIECLEPSERGRFLRVGDPVATIAAGDPIVRTVLSDQEIADTRPWLGQPVQVRTGARAGQTLRGVVTRVTPATSRTFQSHWFRHLTSDGVPVNPATGDAVLSYVELTIELESVPDRDATPPIGATGRVCLDAEAETLAQALTRKVLLFSHRLKAGAW